MKEWGGDRAEELTTIRGAVVGVGSGVKACRCAGHGILLRLVNVRRAVLQQHQVTMRYSERTSSRGEYNTRLILIHRCHVIEA